MTKAATDQPRTDAVDLLSEESRFGDSLKRDHPALWWTTLVGPFALTGAALVVLGLHRGYEWMLQLIGTAAVTFFGLGRFVILLGKDGGGIHPEDAAEQAERARFSFFTAMELFGLVTWMDVCAGVLLVCHAGFLFKIPKLGPALLKVRGEGEFFMRYQPWIRRFTFAGLTLFVMIPVAATGSVGAAIIGRLLGMTRKATLLAILAGTLIGNGLIYLLGRHLVRHIPFFDPSNPLNLLAGVGVILLIVLLLGWRYKKLKARYTASGDLRKAA
ncbi:MAG TPA: small multi-drug export protein [Phycisphaerales bacterium]|nr:small multi-drug export protein [Phycisphaerales bacterium]